jgi:hypothetical protein
MLFTYIELTGVHVFLLSQEKKKHIMVLKYISSMAMCPKFHFEAKVNKEVCKESITIISCSFSIFNQNLLSLVLGMFAFVPGFFFLNKSRVFEVPA